jgi:hypothetical protein
VKCGKDNGLRPAAAQVAAPVAVAPPPPAPPVQPFAPAPGMYAAPPGAIPIAVPPQVPAKKSGTMGSVIVLAILAAGGYWYYTQHKPAGQNPPAAQAPGGGAPPAGQAPPASGAGANADLAKQQAFDAHWQNVNGMIQLSNGTWKNNGSATVQSATLECDQFDAAKNVLNMMRTTLNGPVAPGATDGFSPFWMGAASANLDAVTCTIIHVKQPGQ